jgi:ubiquinone/menaquinone biosynthesis C-methylase UbiE
MFERKSHWEDVYTRKAATEVSWYQPRPEKSLKLIARTGVGTTARIIDVGGGASTLVDALLTQGFQHVTVLDIAAAALETAKRRVGERADEVTWLEADITQANLPSAYYDVWHDRAVFHFLTEAADRRSYIDAVERSLKPGGHIIVATFAVDGPRKCSGLDTLGYSPAELRREFGSNFRLVTGSCEEHLTPFGTTQRFSYSLFERCA